MDLAALAGMSLLELYDVTHVIYLCLPAFNNMCLLVYRHNTLVGVQVGFLWLTCTW